MSADSFNAKISIIVPVYKTEEIYLRKCIESLINQTYSNIEIILVDDGSPDSCSVICDEYAGHDSRITVIHKQNEGTAAARNDGLCAAVGEYITFGDADDRLSSDILELAAKTLSSTNSDMIWFDVVAEYQDRNDLWTNGNVKGIIDFKKTLQLFLEHRLIFSCWGKLISKRCIGSLKLNEKLKRGQDEEFIIRILLENGKSAFCHNKGYFYNLLGDGETRRGFTEKVFSINDMTDIVEYEVLNKYPDLKKSVDTYIAHSMWIMLNQYRNSSTETRKFEEKMLSVLKAHRVSIFRSQLGLRLKLVIYAFIYLKPENFKKIYNKYKKLKRKG